jgi:hypothetical protein
MLTQVSRINRYRIMWIDMYLLDAIRWQIYLIMAYCFVSIGSLNEAKADDSVRHFGKWADVRRCMVEAESERMQVDGSSANPSGRRYLVCQAFAASSDDELYFFCGHEEEVIGSDWHNEPFNIEITIHNEKLTKYRKFNRQVEFADLPMGTKIPDPIASDVLFLFLPIWLSTNYPAPQSKSLGMVFEIKSALSYGGYKPTSERQLIGDEWCTEYNSPNGMDRLWLSEVKDLCLMRREWFDPETKAIAGRIITKRIAEVAQGLWMPVEIEYFRFSSKPVKGEPIPISRTITRVSKWSFDDKVPPEIFQSKLKPGTIELLGPGKFRQISSRGTEHLDDIAAFYRGPIGLPHLTASASSMPRNLACVALGVVGGGLIGAIIFLHRSKSR